MLHVVSSSWEFNSSSYCILMICCASLPADNSLLTGQPVLLYQATRASPIGDCWSDLYIGVLPCSGKHWVHLNICLREPEMWGFFLWFWEHWFPNTWGSFSWSDLSDDGCRPDSQHPAPIQSDTPTRSTSSPWTCHSTGLSFCDFNPCLLPTFLKTTLLAIRDFAYSITSLSNHSSSWILWESWAST